MEARIATAGHWRKQGLKVLTLPPSAQLHRISLNASNDSYFASRQHPSPAKAQDFKLGKRHILPIYDIPNNKVFMYIDTIDDLKFACDIMKCKPEIACDVEGDYRFTYNMITCLIQLSVDSHDFVIDAIKLYEYIKELLEPIFLNGSILKIFFGTCDLPWFQRDFNVFFNSFIDFQHVYDKYNGRSTLSSFASVVKDFLQKDVDKTWQRFPWQLRKIPNEALNYARQDSQFLFDIWQLAKKKYQNFLLTEYDLKHDINAVLKVYKFPKRVIPENKFESIYKDKKMVYNTHKNLYCALYDWCNTTAKLRDVPITQIFNEDELRKLL